jgi:uncharacterized protein (DUF885 family)
MIKFVFPLLLLIMAEITAFAQTTKSEADKLTTLLQAYDEAYLKMFPFNATSRGDYRYNDQFDINTEAHRKQEKDLYTQYLQKLKGVDRQKLAKQDLLNYEVFLYSLENSLKVTELDNHLQPINQFFSMTTDFARNGSGAGIHPFKTEKDYDDFLKRITKYGEWTDTTIHNMRMGMAKGVVQPKILMEKVLPQLQAMVVKDVKESVFYKPVANMPASFSTQAKTRLENAYTQAIQNQIIPSYRKLHDFIQNEYLPKSRTTIGFSDLPSGKQKYAFLVQSYTTTSLSPDQIFDIGMKEVQRIRGEMEKVKDQVGFKGDLQAFLKNLNTDPKLYPFKTEEEVLQAYRAIHTKMQPQLAKTFNLVPKAQFEVRAVEKYRAATVAAHYMRPTADGSRPGVFYAPIVDPQKYNYYQMEALFLHEAIPGHHYQLALQQEQTHLPNLRKFGGFGAYIEGWGLYAEGLGKELGLYTDPYQYLGRLGGDMHRALRLVLDVGIHHKGWSRQQAIDFSLENETYSEQFIISEVERYMAIPGQALSYKIGELKILELRNKAQKTLGNKFDIKAFHDEILKDGALPLAVLETKINLWINTQAKATEAKAGNKN